MRSALPPATNSYRARDVDADLLLRETNHRCSNDLQLVVSLLHLQSQRTESAEASAALVDAAERINVLARARAAVVHGRTRDLESALRQVCEALQPYAEARSILISFRVERPSRVLPPDCVTTLALVVNELMTNAIKHAFEGRPSGRIVVSLAAGGERDVVVIVDDDGRPYASKATTNGTGLGLALARRLIASVDGLLVAPEGSSKRFELRVPSVDKVVA